MSRIPALGPRGEGWLVLQVILIVLIVVGFDVGPRLVPPGDPSTEPFRTVGRIVVFAGLALILWSSAQLRAAGSFSATPRPRSDGTFVETGPYRFIRHPLYAGLIVAGIGTGFLRLSWIEFGLTGLLLIVLDLKRRREEAWLVEQYPAYAAYRARTRALVPLLY